MSRLNLTPCRRPSPPKVLYDHLGSWSDAMAVLVALMLVECVLAWFAASPKTLAQSKAG